MYSRTVCCAHIDTAGSDPQDLYRSSINNQAESTMSEAVKIPHMKGPQGEDIFGHPVDVIESKESFSQVKLSDFTVIKVKAITKGAVRLVNHWNDDGTPQYIVSTDTVIQVVSSPPEFRKNE